MSSQTLSSRSLLNLGENAYLQPRIVLRDDKEKDPVQIKIRVKKPKKTRSLERPVCFRVRDGRPVEPIAVCPPARISSRPRPCVPRGPAYDVAPVVYVNSDGTTSQTPVAEPPRDPDCGCPISVDNGAVEKTITKQASGDEPLVIRIGPTGELGGNGCDERPVYKINFKDNVMNVTSNVDFMVKKMERTLSTVEKDPEAQKYLIKPIQKHIPPVTVTVRPNPLGNQTTTESQSETASTRTRTVPNEYAESRTRTVQQTASTQQYQPQYTPEQLAAAYQQQQQAAPAQQYQPQYTPEQLAAAYQQQQAQQVPQPMLTAQPQQAQGQYQYTPEQVAAAYREQQAANPNAPQYQFTPEELAAAYQQQNSGTPGQPAQMQITPEQIAQAYKEQQAANPQGGQEYQFTPEQLANAYRQQQAGQFPPSPYQQQQPPAAPVAYAQPPAAPVGYAQPPAATAYAQPPAAQNQAYAYPQAPPQAYAYTQAQPAAYAQTAAQPQAYAYPQQQPAAPAQQYAYPQASQPQAQPQQFQFNQFPPQVGA